MKRSPATNKAPKPKKCRACKAAFTPLRPMQVACSPACALALAEKQRSAAERAKKSADRKITREAKARLKTRSDWLKEAQVAFNAYVRARDAGKPCICCGRPLGVEAVGGAYDCGHYRSVGSAPHLRFHEDNAHGQLKQCNRWGAGRAVDYRIGLIRRIGIAAVDRLEADQQPRKWTVEELKQIRDTYREKLKEVKRRGDAAFAIP